ncbi:MAG TPA: lysylphosphatidylglycerol synthase transmembrane domain-containing protein [Gaiellaceae bacterium]|nr:lysylphosphatidylglycerol synthase transmembrane domain-containing protein [Gaiellaceae bacterium]
MRTVRGLLRPALATAVLAVVVWRVGTGPFLDGVRDVDGRALAFAGAVGALTTVCCAWRWSVVARGLGVPLSLPSAVAAYYRSVFLNLSLPGGVAGDVHRGVRHGRDVHDVGRALRSVAWERAAGQFVQAVITAAVLVVLPSPVHRFMPVACIALVALAAGVVLVARRRNVVATDIRDGLLRRRALPVIVLTSTVVVLGHAATFVVAARTAGVDASVVHLLPLTLLAMLGMVLPSLAGWGPREGVTAWVFAAAGLGAGRGAAAAVAYGVIVLAAGLPGALVLLAEWIPRPARVAVDGRSR